jgi:CheY-like chemotaxis protein
MRSDVDQAHAAGCNAHLGKPIRREQLRAVLLELMPDAARHPTTTP